MEIGMDGGRSESPPAPPAKLAWVALALEVALPGAGALYLGRITLGVTWLVVSVAASALASITITGDAYRATYKCPYPGQDVATGFACALANPFGASAIELTMSLALIALITLMWLGVRLSVITNTLLERRRGSGQLANLTRSVSAARIAALELGLALTLAGLVVWYAVGMGLAFTDFTVLPQDQFTPYLWSYLANDFGLLGLSVAFVAIGAYLLALRRLPRIGATQALAEGLGLAIVASLAPPVPLGYSPLYLVAGGLGALVATTAAPWRALRARFQAPTTGDGAWVIALVVITWILTNAPTSHYSPSYLARLAGFGDVSINDDVVFMVWSMVGGALLLALAAGGAILAARRLRRLAPIP